MNRQASSPRFRFVGAAFLLLLLMFLVPALREGDRRLYLLAALVPGCFLVSVTLLARFFSLDRFLLSLTLLLCSAGIAAFALTDPEAAFAQALRCAAGLGVLVLGAVLVRSLSDTLLTALASGFLGILALSSGFLSPSSALPLAGVGQALLLISLGALLSSGRVLAALVLGIGGTALLAAGHGLVPALVWSLVFLMLLWSADGSLFTLLAGGALAGVLLFVFRTAPGGASISTQEPSVPVLRVLVSAGWIGTDHLPDGLSAGTSSLFPLLSAHYGLPFAGLTAFLLLPLFQRGAFIAGISRSRFHAVVAMGCSLLAAFRAIAALLSVFGILPLPECPFPLLTSSLPDLCAGMVLPGLLCGISGRAAAELEDDARLAMLAH